jgi:hypothetical protein
MQQFLQKSLRHAITAVIPQFASNVRRAIATAVSAPDQLLQCHKYPDAVTSTLMRSQVP